jgi:signal transduction histidine kinase
LRPVNVQHASADALVAQLPYAVLVVDAEGTVVFGNARARQLLETQSELEGTALSTLVRPPRGEADVLRRQTDTDGEVRRTLLTAEGARRRVAVRAAPVAYGDHQDATLVTLRAVDARPQADAVTQTVELLDNAFHLGPAALLLVRLRDGLILEVSDRLSEVVGLSAGDLVGQTLPELDLDLQAERWADLAHELVAHGEIQVREFQLCGGDGTARPFLGSARRVTLDGTAGALVSLIDVRALADQVRTRTDANSPVRSALLTTLTHEVRTPLTSILGFTSILRKGVPDKYRRFVDLIDRSGRRLQLMLDAILDLAQLEGGTLEVHRDLCAVQCLVRENTESLVEEARAKGLDVTLDLGDECVHAHVDPKLFGRVLQHLVGNAVKFTSEGRIRIEVEARSSDVVLTIADTGEGIGARALDRVVQPFVQESEGQTRSHQGCGLGLSVSKRLLDRQGGRLQIDSEKGEGTVVTITLPRVTDLS